MKTLIPLCQKHWSIVQNIIPQINCAENNAVSVQIAPNENEP